jgi:hypothetical protein
MQERSGGDERSELFDLYGKQIGTGTPAPPR